MLVVTCILAVLNLALSCDDTNEIWWFNMLAGLYLSACLAAEVGV